MGVTSLITRLKNWLYLKSELLELADFFACLYKSRKLQVASMIFGWTWSKMYVAF